ncbi:hypothetical protein [Azospirillum sp. sgz301742]
MRAPWLAALLPAALSFALGPAAAREPLRTEPGHMHGMIEPYVTPQPGLPRTQHIRAQVVYRLPKGISEMATRDATLSHLCQRGAFIPEKSSFYWAHTPDRAYAVAFSGGANLTDPQKKRKPGKVYFFDLADARCTVWIGDQAKLMAHYVGPLPGD